MAIILGSKSLCIQQNKDSPCKEVTLWGIDLFKDSDRAADAAHKFLISKFPPKPDNVIMCKKKEKANPKIETGTWQCFDTSNADIGLQLVKNGYAKFASELRQNDKEAQEYREAESEAAKKDLGAWYNIDPTQKITQIEQKIDNLNEANLLRRVAENEERIKILENDLPPRASRLEKEVAESAQNIKDLKKSGLCEMVTNNGDFVAKCKAAEPIITNVAGGLTIAVCTASGVLLIGRRKKYKELRDYADKLKVILCKMYNAYRSEHVSTENETFNDIEQALQDLNSQTDVNKESLKESAQNIGSRVRYFVEEYKKQRDTSGANWDQEKRKALFERLPGLCTSYLR